MPAEADSKGATPEAGTALEGRREDNRNLPPNAADVKAQSSALGRGFVMLSRGIQDSPIWRESPHLLKLFLWLIIEARYNQVPKHYPGVTVNRGELVTSLAHIAEANEYAADGTIKRWHRNTVSRMLDRLAQSGYIVRGCDTYGTHITICNYERYQTADNYRCDSACTPLVHRCDTPGAQPKKEKKEKNDQGETTSLRAPLSGDALSICLAVRDHVLDVDPKARLPSGDSFQPDKGWGESARLMLTRDGRTLAEVLAVIEWVAGDNFWRANILSVPKLRAKFSQLVGKVKGKSAPWQAGPQQAAAGAGSDGIDWDKDTVEVTS